MIKSHFQLLRGPAKTIWSVLFILSLGQASVFAQGDGRGEGGEERRREWRPGGPDGGGRWEDRGDRRGGGGGRRGGWNPEEFLKRLDSNGDGKLEESEMSGRTKKFLTDMGFDPSKPIELNTVVDKIRADRGEAPQGTKKEDEAERRVPGFSSKDSKVPGFGSNSVEEDLSSFGEDVIRQVDWVLDNYDKNKNKVLDADELADVPAGPPPLTDSDSNRDGKLSRLELANRYRARAQYSRRNEGQSRNGERTPNSPGENRRSDARGRFASEPSSGSNRSRSSSRSSSRNASGSSVRTQQDRASDSSQIEKTNKYVENIIVKYDLDKDGKLSASEVSESGIRNPPKADENGFVTKEAYVNFLVGPKTTTPSVSGSVNSSRESASSPSAREDSSRSRRGNSDRASSDSVSSEKPSRKVTFEDYDEDGNGMVEMHEFSEEWDDALLESFYEKDKNRDGVITGKEWKGYN